MSDFGAVPFEQAFVSVPVGNRKIQESEYDPNGSICVVDQGKRLVSGRTNRNDLLINDGPYIVFGDHTRTVKYVDFPFVAGADGVRLFKAAENFEPEFLYLFLSNAELPMDGYGRHSKHLKHLFVPYFCRQQQRQIAARLKDQLAEVEIARQAAQVQVQDVELLRQRLLRQTFAALYDAPCKVLGEWARTTSGSTPPRGDKRYWSPAEIPWVKTGEVAFAPITHTEESISRRALAECSLTLLPPRTVLVAMIGQGKTRGQSAILEIEATTNQNSFAILPNEIWDDEFMHHWLMASYEDLRELSASRGGSQSALNGALLNALEIPAPDVGDQRRIVTRLKSELAEAAAIAQAAAGQLAEIERLPQRLLAQAFDS